MSNPINTFPIQQFIQQVKAADLSQQKEVRLDIKSAKMISFTLTEILAKITQDYDTMYKQLSKSSGETITVQFDGGSFGNEK